MSSQNQTNQMLPLVVRWTLETLKYVLSLGALFVMLLFFAFPKVAEDFYLDAGNEYMAFTFMNRAVRDNPDYTGLLIRTTNLCLSLSSSDAEFKDDAERYLTTLLSREGVEERFSQIDRYNLDNSPSVYFHPNLYSVKDYYVQQLYKLRLEQNRTDLYYEGEYVTLAEFVTEQLELGSSTITAVNQISSYLDYCYKNQVTLALGKSDIIAIYQSVEAIVLTPMGERIDITSPTLERLYNVNALKNLAENANKFGYDLGKLEQTDWYDCENVTKLYNKALINYANNIRK